MKKKENMGATPSDAARLPFGTAYQSDLRGYLHDIGVLGHVETDTGVVCKKNAEAEFGSYLFLTGD